jgi:hypothetical protein
LVLPSDRSWAKPEPSSDHGTNISPTPEIRFGGAFAVTVTEQVVVSATDDNTVRR